jgi:hypothetical protein
LSLIFYKPGWWLGLLGTVGLMQLQAEAATTLSVATTNPPPSYQAVSLGWTPSPSANVTGYLLNWGLASGQCTNHLDVGNVTNSTVGGLTTNIAYYFNVVAYDAAGDQAPPSNELTFTPVALTLSLQLQGSGTNRTVGVNFQGMAGATYVIQATQDFRQWTTLGTTNCLAGGPVSYAVADPTFYPLRFYRVGKQ